MLPTVDDLREYLRIEQNAEDQLLDRLLTQARAAVEAIIGQPIEARPVTVTLYARSVDRGYYGTGYATRLAFPYAPIAAPVTVRDADGETVDASTYTVIDVTGGLRAVDASPFTTGVPYTVTATAGLSLRDDYAAAIEPVMSSAIIDWAADLYQRRNPAASYESGGGGVAVNYNETASKTMPSRIRVTLEPWRRIPV